MELSSGPVTVTSRVLTLGTVVRPYLRTAEEGLKVLTICCNVSRICLKRNDEPAIDLTGYLNTIRIFKFGDFAGLNVDKCECLKSGTTSLRRTAEVEVESRRLTFLTACYSDTISKCLNGLIGDFIGDTLNSAPPLLAFKGKVGTNRTVGIISEKMSRNGDKSISINSVNEECSTAIGACGKEGVGILTKRATKPCVVVLGLCYILAVGI